MKDKNSGKLYGRARRIEFGKKILYAVIAIVAIAITINFVVNYKGFVDNNVNFAYLKQYMEAKGYYCNQLQNSGGQCILHGEISTSTFTRYEDGFDFTVKSNAYNLNIKHISTKEDYITFKTNVNALTGYKSKNYTCNVKNNIIGELEECIDENQETLDSDTYLSIIKLAIQDLNNFIDSSGYDKKSLMNDYKWIKK